MCIADKKTSSLISDGRICFYSLKAGLLKGLLSFRINTSRVWQSHLQRKQRSFVVMWTTETDDCIQVSTDIPKDIYHTSSFVLSWDPFTWNARTVVNDGNLIFFVEQHSFQTAWTNRQISTICLDYVFRSSAFFSERVLVIALHCLL